MKLRRNRELLLVCGLAAAVFLAGSALALQKSSSSQKTRNTAPASRQQIDRGRYLVEEIAKCTECHTPRKSDGELDPQAWLQGAPIWIRPVTNIQPWADRAPALAGLPSFTSEDMEKVLERGTGPHGEALRPPMHIYHMNRQDALAIIAYLQSLPTPMH